MEHLKMHSMNKIDENVSKIAQLFPNCVTEAKADDGTITKKIDFDMLKQELSSTLVEGREERYQFTWPDKKQAILTANAPINKTLRPCREESVNFDETENLYIEGDNLEVLKLLQETYLGKIKMIYIDPPYNTGSDFVYADDFAQEANEYISNSGQVDEVGNKLVANTESNGRFHTDWLNMMYSRLKLAKDLLTDDGVIAISLDDNEIYNLRKICDEIFSEENFINNIAIKMSTASGVKLSHRDKKILKTKEYCMVYCKNKDMLKINPQYLKKEKWDEYYEWYVDKIGPDCGKWKVYKLDDYLKSIGIENKNLDNKKFQEFYFQNADKIWQRGRNTSIPQDILQKSNDNWETIFEYKDDTGVAQYCYKGRRMAFLKNVMQDCINSDGRIVKDMGTLICDFWQNISTAALFAEGGIEFPNGKKPQLLLNTLLRMFTSENDYVLDFFSGSASTAEAVMRLNYYDNKKHKFIMVQIPEICDTKSELYKKGFTTICEVGKERIRRSGTKIIEEAGSLGKNLDIGFRVLKCDSSNMEDVYYSPEHFNKQDLFKNNIKNDRSAEDLLFQVMLDLGIILSSKIETKQIDGKTVFYVEDNYLIACFDEDVTEETITKIAKETPYYFVMKDSSMANDSVATNFEQIFTTYSPETIRKVL